MSNWIIKSVDQMKISQDVATNPPSSSTVDTVVSKAKDLGATHVAISVPYDLPNGGGDVIAQTDAWVKAGVTHGVNIWHRHSWCSDQGWYGVPQDFTNDRIQDTVNWIKAHQGFFKDGDIFTPKPEPQNCGIQGVNTGGQGRWASAAAFNQWVRDITAACKNAFTSLGIHVKVGYFGFDGYIVCGYGNPDWQGKSFLETATVAAMDNIITGDHYPPAGTTMADFLSVFKKTWPNIQFVEGEYGPIQSGDVVTQITTDIGALAAEPIVIGLNYWTESDNGAEALLDGSYNITPSYTAMQTFFQGTTPPPTPTPVPTPQPTPTNPPAQLGGMDLGSYAQHLDGGSAKLNGAGSTWIDTKTNTPIDLNAACSWQYNQPAIANQLISNNPYSFVCVSSSVSVPTPQPTPTPAPTPGPTIITYPISGTVVITKDATGKTSLKIDATG